jgi:hypothetical protein
MAAGEKFATRTGGIFELPYSFSLVQGTRAETELVHALTCECCQSPKRRDVHGPRLAS